MLLICLPVGLLVVSQAGLEPAFGARVEVAEPLLFSQCNMVQRSLVWAGGSGCGSPDSSWYFFSDKCGPSISAHADLWSSCCLLLYSSHHLGSPVVFLIVAILTGVR
jgi:hypothetical protein